MAGLTAASRLLGIGMYVAVSIVVCSLAGRELDKLLNIEPALTLAGLLLGVFLALYGAVTQLLEVMAELNRRHTEGKKE